MTFLGGILWLIEELLTFVLPIFYTFRALMADRDKPVKIKMVLKYWCILSLYFLLRVALENVIEETLFPFIDFSVLILLNYQQLNLSETIYDMIIMPLYRNNKTFLQSLSNSIERVFQKKSSALKDKVATSTGDTLKGFMGEILVGVLNPAQKNKQSTQQEEEDRDNNED